MEKMEMFMREFIAYTDKILDGDNIWSLEQEFNDLREESSYLELSCEIGKRPENRRKNRYRDILPFDDTRVTLPPILDEPDSDFINANFVRGATGQHYSYIAAQGPLRHTLGDFWRMLFHYNVNVIVMLCNERENDKPKCERYWPTAADGPSMHVDVFDAQTLFADYVNFTGGDRQANSWSAKIDPADDGAGHETANGTATEQDNEKCVAMYFELELLSETDTLEGYYVRRICATKFEVFLTSSPESEDAEIAPDRPPSIKSEPAAAADAGQPAGDDAAKDTIAVESTNPDADRKDTNDAPDETAKTNSTPPKKSTPRRVTRTEKREFVQYHYRNWADYAAADELDSILEMHAAFRRFQPSLVVPICVHCSAGCGRTGTVLFIDYVNTLVNRGLLSRFLLRKRKEQVSPTQAKAKQLDGGVEPLKLDFEDAEDRHEVPRLRLDDVLASHSDVEVDLDGEQPHENDSDYEYDYERSANEFVRSIVLEFRRQRPASVQSFEQFVMCYRATCEIFRKQLELLDAHHYVNLEELRTARRFTSPRATSPEHMNTDSNSQEPGSGPGVTPADAETSTETATVTITHSKTVKADDEPGPKPEPSLPNASDSTTTTTTTAVPHNGAPENTETGAPGGDKAMDQTVLNKLDDESAAKATEPQLDDAKVSSDK